MVDEESLEGCEIIEEPSHPHHLLQLIVGQILIEHCQIVAEIEECLLRIRLWQGSAAEMIDLAFGETIYTFAHLMESPAEVNLLVVGEETPVEASRFPVVGRPYEQTSPCGP